MNNGPLKEFRGEDKKAIKVVVWQQEDDSLSYVIEKSYKKRDEPDWTRLKVTLYPDEFKQLYKLIKECAEWRLAEKASAEKAGSNEDEDRKYVKQTTKRDLNNPPPVEFEDDDLAF
jgi:hypothetical protein